MGKKIQQIERLQEIGKTDTSILKSVFYPSLSNVKDFKHLRRMLSIILLIRAYSQCEADEVVQWRALLDWWEGKLKTRKISSKELGNALKLLERRAKAIESTMEFYKGFREVLPMSLRQFSIQQSLLMIFTKTKSLLSSTNTESTIRKPLRADIGALSAALKHLREHVIHMEGQESTLELGDEIYAWKVLMHFWDGKMREGMVTSDEVARAKQTLYEVRQTICDDIKRLGNILGVHPTEGLAQGEREYTRSERRMARKLELNQLYLDALETDRQWQYCTLKLEEIVRALKYQRSLFLQESQGLRIVHLTAWETLIRWWQHVLDSRSKADVANDGADIEDALDVVDQNGFIESVETAVSNGIKLAPHDFQILQAVRPHLAHQLPIGAVQLLVAYLKLIIQMFEDVLPEERLPIKEISGYAVLLRWWSRYLQHRLALNELLEKLRESIPSVTDKQAILNGLELPDSPKAVDASFAKIQKSTSADQTLVEPIYEWWKSYWLLQMGLAERMAARSTEREVESTACNTCFGDTEEDPGLQQLRLGGSEKWTRLSSTTTGKEFNLTGTKIDGKLLPHKDSFGILRWCGIE